MENKELNDNLAEWAGFIPKGTAYVWPNNKFDFAPNFTSSLDACFKWLIPKVGKVIIQFDNNFNHWYCSLVLWDNPKGITIAKEETPALALCLAIEKLSDGEQK